MDFDDFEQRRQEAEWDLGRVKVTDDFWADFDVYGQDPIVAYENAAAVLGAYDE